MLDLIKEQAVIPKNSYLGPAEILEMHEGGGFVRIRVPGSDENHEVWARWAIPYAHETKRGGKVLVAGQAIDELYVIGLLDIDRTPVAETQRVVLKSGASATVAGGPNAEKLQLRSKEGDLVIEYDAETAKTRIHVGKGDLEFVAKEGNINFISGQNILFSSGQEIELRSILGIRLATIDAIGKILSSLTLRSRRLKMTSPEVAIAAQRSEIKIEETKYLGGKLSITIRHARFITGKIEIFANDVLQRAKNIYTTVEGLSQLTAQRMKTLIYSTYHFRSQKAFLKAEEDFKVNAEKIHLG